MSSPLIDIVAETSFLDAVVEQFGMLPDVDGGAGSYRTFCFHVKGVIAAACGIELLVIVVSALSSKYSNLFVCWWLCRR